VMGLQDGQALIRTSAVYHHFATPTSQAGTGRDAGTYGMDDVSTGHILRLTRRGEPYLQECLVTGNDK
jgi:hypothetical protein